MLFALPQTLRNSDLHGARHGRRAWRRRGAVPSSLEPRPANLPLRKLLVYLQHLEHGLTQTNRAPNMVLTSDLGSLRDGNQRKKMMADSKLW